MKDKLFPSQYERIKQTAGVKTDLELAEILGITSSGITNAKARGVVPHKWFLKIAGVYNVDIDWLKYGDATVKSEETAKKRNKQGSCSRCEELEAKLYTSNERLYQAGERERVLLLENGELKVENAALQAENAELRRLSLSTGTDGESPLANTA